MGTELLQEKDLLYRQTDEEVEIVGYTGSMDRIEIPEAINGKPVTSLGYCGVGNLDGVTVVLNNCVRRIELDAIAYRNARSSWENDKYSWIYHIEAKDGQPFFSVEKDVLYSKDKCKLIMCFKRDAEKFTIPKTVKTISEYAFFACDELNEVIIPKTVQFVGDYAFNSGTTVTVKGYETVLGTNIAGAIKVDSSSKYVVENGYLLTADGKRLLKKTENTDTFIVPDTVEEIDDDALGRFVVSSISLNDHLRRIGHRVFRRANVKTIDIPNSVEHMEADAFSGYDKYIRIHLLPGNNKYRSDGTAIYSVADDGSEAIFCITNKAITQFKVPEKVKSLGADVFDGCNKLKSIILNEGLELFDEACLAYPINNGVKLERIFIPCSVKRIELGVGEGVLNGSVKYSIDERNPYYYMDDDVCYEATDDGQYRVLFCQNKKAGRIIVNNGTISIAKYAFSMPGSLRYSDRNAASYCSRLTEVELPTSLLTIEEGAFLHCTSLESVIVGPSVENIDDSAFFGCKKLQAISVSKDNQCYCDIDGVLFDKSQKKLIIYPEGRSTDKYEIPESVEDFGNAFTNVDCVKTLYLSKNIKRIVKYAFPHECKIEALYVKNDIKEIDPCAFGAEAYETSTREKAIDVYVDSKFYFAQYVQNEMRSPKGDVSICDETDTPEVKRIKKQFSFKNVKDGLCITSFLEPSHGKKSSPTITIPGMLGNQPVVEMGDNMFGQLSYGIETIIVSEGIKRIGASVFFGHSNLTKIVFPASVEEISPWVFTDDDRKYKDLYLQGEDLAIVVEPDSYAESFIFNYQFKNDNRPRIIINGDGPDYLKMIPDGKSYTAKLQSGLEHTDRMIVPNTYRGKPVSKVVLFEGSWGELPEEILALSIPDNVKEIVGLKKFKPTKKTSDHLPCISIAEGNKNYWSDGKALYTKDKKTLLQLIDYTVSSYTVCEETRTISERAFSMCTALKKVKLSNNTTILGKAAFSGCSSLAEIVGMEYLSEVGTDAISGTAFEKNNEYIVIGTTLTKYNGTQSVFSVPEGVETIGEGAFRLFSFGNSAPDSLEAIVLPTTLKIISPSAFYGRKKLKTINLPEGLLTIGRSAFSGCTSLEKICIPSTVTELSTDVFPDGWDKDESALAMIEVSKENPVYCTENNVLYDKAKTEIIMIPAYAQIDELVVPATVKKIRGAKTCKGIKQIVISSQVDDWNGAFSDCAILTSVSFNCSQERIADHAFSGCRKLKEISFPTGLREIGNGSFKKTNIKNVVLPDTLEHIGEEAFADTGMKKASLPKSVKTLGWGAFSCVPEIEVYDTIDPDAKDASEKIDTVNGSPNSLVGYIGMGPANAMWQCAANHKWVNYTITVKSAETDDVKYKVWMGADGSQRQYYCFLSSAWGHNATFAFKQLDEFFSKIRGADHKLQVAQYRVAYPYDLTDEARKKYEAYIKKNAQKGEK